MIALFALSSLPLACAFPKPGHHAERSAAIQLERRLDEELTYPQESARARQTGFVRVAFTLDAEGRPSLIHLAGVTSWPALNQAALETVRRVGRIACGAAGARYLAVLQFDQTTVGKVFEKRRELKDEGKLVRRELARQIPVGRVALPSSVD